MTDGFITINDASEWASSYLDRTVSNSNISYLIQYGKIKKHRDESGNTVVKKTELQHYYDDYILKKQEQWDKQLGEEVNWVLSFDQLPEAERTKHVHRLHPYKGKFIPQLVEYFLDTHTDKFKTEIFFNKGDVVLDPFMGSGTTLIQASELGIHSIGIDVSGFNCLMSKVKTKNYNLFEVNFNLENALSRTMNFSKENFDDRFDTDLRTALSEFNQKHKLNPRETHNDRSDKDLQAKVREFYEEHDTLITKNGTKLDAQLVDESEMPTFLNKWFTKRIRHELFFYLNQIETVTDEEIQNLMRIILSRTARSCRATTHYDLATLKEPQFGPYYCYKHRKICLPVNTIIKHLRKNTRDTIKRFEEYSKLKKDVEIEAIHGDSRTVNIFSEILKNNEDLFKILKKKKISGIFTSPPYVGQIDYHEQHAYAYELFNISRKDEDEIGPLYKGKGKTAREEYVQGISDVLNNIKGSLKKTADIFIVANDKFNLYPRIAENSGLKIINTFKRPVLNRTERDRQPYSETIFHMKKG